MAEFTRLLWLVACEIAVVALLVLCNAMLPGLLGRTRQTIIAMPGRSFLVGLLNGAFFGVLSAALLAPGGGIALIGGTLAALLLAFVAAGLAAAARIVGERLRPNATDPLRQFLAGAGTLSLASSVPLVGWFVVLPCAALIGFGALLIAIVQRRAAPDPHVATSPPPLPWEANPQATHGDAQGWR
jgi:hypothetical protein